MVDEEVPGYFYAFNDRAEEEFNFITALINHSIEKSGKIDATEICDKIDKKRDYKHANSIAIKLFSGERNAKIISNLYKNQNPASRANVEVINYFTIVGSDMDAYQKLRKKKEELEKAKNKWLEVKEYSNGYRVEPHKSR